MSGSYYTGVLFQEPCLRPLTAAGQFQQCYLVFQTLFISNAVPQTILPVYRDAKLQYPHRQLTLVGGNANLEATTGVLSDAVGRFDPIYLDPSLAYSYSLYTAAGVLLEQGGYNQTTDSINTPNTNNTLVAVKYSDTSRSNSAVLANDPALQINIPYNANASVAYKIEADLCFLSASGTQGLSLNVVYTNTLGAAASAALAFLGLLNNLPATGALNINNPGSYTVSASQSQNTIKLVGTLIFGTPTLGSLAGNPQGTLSVKWAQTTASTTPLTLKAGSALYATLL